MIFIFKPHDAHSSEITDFGKPVIDIANPNYLYFNSNQVSFSEIILHFAHGDTLSLLYNDIKSFIDDKKTLEEMMEKVSEARAS